MGSLLVDTGHFIFISRLPIFFGFSSNSEIFAYYFQCHIIRQKSKIVSIYNCKYYETREIWLCLFKSKYAQKYEYCYFFAKEYPIVLSKGIKMSSVILLTFFYCFYVAHRNNNQLSVRGTMNWTFMKTAWYTITFEIVNFNFKDLKLRGNAKLKLETIIYTVSTIYSCFNDEDGKTGQGNLQILLGINKFYLFLSKFVAEDL